MRLLLRANTSGPEGRTELTSGESPLKASDNENMIETDIPLPTRPGTLWKTDHEARRCLNCSKPYNSHGAPEGTPQAHGLPAETPRHLMCPASDEAWDKYHRHRRRNSVFNFALDVLHDF